MRQQYRPKTVKSSSQTALSSETNTPAGAAEGEGSNDRPRYIVKATIMATVTEQRPISHESDNHIIVDDPRSSPDTSFECNRNAGILKGGKFWRSSSDTTSGVDLKAAIDADVDAVGCQFSNTTCAGVDFSNRTDKGKLGVKFVDDSRQSGEDSCSDTSDSDRGAEFTLTFNLGNRVVVPCNSLKPNSAVRQLFPDPRFVDAPATTTISPPADCKAAGAADSPDGRKDKYLVTEESLQAFDEVNRRSVFATYGDKEYYCPHEHSRSGSATRNDDETCATRNRRMKKTIQRNTLRRSLIRCSQRGKSGNQQPAAAAAANKTAALSLEERIKLLTCVTGDNEQRRLSTDSTADNESWPTTESEITLQRRTSLPAKGVYQYRDEEATAASVASSSLFSTHSTSLAASNSSGAICSAYSPKSDEYAMTDLFCRNSADTRQTTAGEQQPRRLYHQTVHKSTGRPRSDIDTHRIRDAARTPQMKSSCSDQRPRQQLYSAASYTSCVTQQTDASYGKSSLRRRAANEFQQNNRLLKFLIRIC